MDNEERKQRGRDAEELLALPAFEDTINRLMQEQWIVFQATDPYDAQGRERVHAYTGALKGIKTQLESWKYDAQQLRGDFDEQGYND